MAYTNTHRDTAENAVSGGNTLPPLASDVTPAPHFAPAVSIFRYIAFVPSVTMLFSRPHLPCAVPAVALNGTRPRCTQAFRTSAMACRAHMLIVWLLATGFGPPGSQILRALLWRGRRPPRIPSPCALPTRSAREIS